MSYKSTGRPPGRARRPDGLANVRVCCSLTEEEAQDLNTFIAGRTDPSKKPPQLAPTLVEAAMLYIRWMNPRKPPTMPEEQT